MIQAPFYYRLAPGTHSAPHDRGSRGFCCLNISSWTAASTLYHHTRASPVPNLLCLSGHSYKGPGPNSSRKKPILLPSWELPGCNSPCGLVLHSIHLPRILQREISLCLPSEMLPGTNNIQARRSSPEAPGSLLTALWHLLSSSVPCAVRESALPAPAAQSQSKCWAVHSLPPLKPAAFSDSGNHPSRLEGEFWTDNLI